MYRGQKSANEMPCYISDVRTNHRSYFISDISAALELRSMFD